jgi:CubicO group peptidase (beta-lactamase class C family)
VGVLLARVIVDRAADVDDLVLRWLPELPDWTGSVRLGHLIHHTSGLPDVTDPALGIPRSNADVIERFQRLQPFRALTRASGTPTTTLATCCSPKR